MGAGTIYETRTGLSAIVNGIYDGTLPEHVITKRGKPVARIVPIDSAPDVSKRIGGKKGKVYVTDDTAFDSVNADIVEMFGM